MRQSFYSIAQAVGQSLGGVFPYQIGKKSRRRTICLARSITFFVARSELGMSYYELGAEIHPAMDHSTVMYHVDRVAKLVSRDDPQVVAAVTAGECAAHPFKGIRPGENFRIRARLREITRTIETLREEEAELRAMVEKRAVGAE